MESAMINYTELDNYSYQMLNDSLSISKLIGFLLNCAMNQRGEISEEEIRKAFEFMKARYKQNIEKQKSWSDEQKDQAKHWADDFYERCEQMLRAELEKRCKVERRHYENRQN